MNTPDDAISLYDNAALRAREHCATEALGDAGVLMERAGLAGWHCALAHWPQAQRLVVVCGPGNNGGDGYVLARHAHLAGRDVRVLRLDAHAPRGDLARTARQAYEEAGGQTGRLESELVDCDLLVDALFGIGLSRAPDEASARCIEIINATDCPRLSLDVPSGVDAERGSVPGEAVRATHTLQFLAEHAGLHTGGALDHVGERSLATLDVPAGTLAASAPSARLLQQQDLAGLSRPRSRNAHKGQAGHVLCIGGDVGMGGAILLCAEAALRAGCGLVSVATRAQHIPALLARRPEAMAHATGTPEDLVPLIDAADVLAIGPGLGLDAWGRDLLAAALESGKPLVLDADALNLIATTPCSLPADVVLTPHPGEAARLLGSSAADVQADRFAAVRALSGHLACVVVLKGAGSLVAAPDQLMRVIGAGNPGMAVGGMGDVLTGVIAALRAQGQDAFDAASKGALLHACAGDRAARAGGERGLLPSDLFPHLRALSNS